MERGNSRKGRKEKIEEGKRRKRKKGTDRQMNEKRQIRRQKDK